MVSSVRRGASEFLLTRSPESSRATSSLGGGGGSQSELSRLPLRINAASADTFRRMVALPVAVILRWTCLLRPRPPTMLTH